MRILLAKNWWSLVLRGLAAIVLGLLTLLWPGITLYALVLLFGAYALLDGAGNLAGVLRASQAHARWGVLLLEGLAGLIVAAITIAWPGITLLALIYLIGAWALITGVLEIAAAVRLRRYVAGEWLLALGGVLSVVFGILVLFAPLAGAVALALWFGAYAIVFGALLIALGLRLRGWTRTYAAGSPLAAPI